MNDGRDVGVARTVYAYDDSRAMGREPSKTGGVDCDARVAGSTRARAHLERFSTYSVIFKPMCAARTRARGPARARAVLRIRVPVSPIDAVLETCVKVCKPRVADRRSPSRRAPTRRGTTRRAIVGRSTVAASRVRRRARANEGGGRAREARTRTRARGAVHASRARARARVVDRARDDRGGGRAGVARGDADDIRAVRVEETGRVVEQRARLESKVFGVEARRRRSRAAGTRLGAAARDEVASGDELWDRERSYVVRAGAREGLFQHG